MRAITPVFSVLLILALSVALVSFLWLFITGTFDLLKLTGTSTVNESLFTISSCMRIESVHGNQASIRNCGKGVIDSNTLNAYLDDVPLNITSFSTSGHYDVCSSEGEYGTITVSCLNSSVIQSIENSVFTDSSSPASCSNPDPAGFCNKYCNAANSCIGQNSCSFPVYNDYCGYPDPCPEINKKLILKVACNKTMIDEDETGTIGLSGLGNFSLGGHTLRITNPKVVAEMPVKASLQDFCAENCVLDLEFDEGSENIAYDSSNYGNDGLLGDGTCNPGSGRCPAWVDGKFGKALSFDGNLDRVNVSSSSSLVLSTFSVEVWFKVTGFPSNPNMPWATLVSKNWSSSPGFWFGIQNGTDTGVYPLPLTNTLVFSTLNNGGVRSNAFLNNTLTANVWYHAVAVYDGSSIKLFLNEQKIDEKPQTGIMNITDNIIIGYHGAGSASPFNGTIDRVIITPIAYDSTITLSPVSYD